MVSSLVNLEEQHILAVDDNPNNLLLIELILQEHGINHIHKAVTAAQAYEQLSTHPIDAIFMDVMMPEVDGIEACKVIRSNKAYDNIPIIMVTEKDDNQTFKESFNAGADDFIPKPINDVILLARLRSQLEKYHMQKSLVGQSRFSAMDEIISILAHQWRQPLGVINSISNTIRTKMELETATNKDYTESFDQIEHYLGELSTMINSFKTSFGSNESVACIDIEKTIKDVVDFNYETLNSANIKVNLDTTHQLSRKISKQALVQVLAHLIHNSINFAKPKEENPTITISLTQEGAKTTIIIEDNGTGIDEETLPFIFDPYFSTKLEKNGKGLGLYFARQLVSQQLKGTLNISSENQSTKAVIEIEKLELC
jgi:two-component system, sensor histidine kinase and response regulator